MGYIKNKCPQCNSFNITPTNKRRVGNKDVCQYVCENCGDITDDMVYYESDKARVKVPSCLFCAVLWFIVPPFSVSLHRLDKGR